MHLQNSNKTSFNKCVNVTIYTLRFPLTFFMFKFTRKNAQQSYGLLTCFNKVVLARMNKVVLTRMNKVVLAINNVVKNVDIIMLFSDDNNVVATLFSHHCCS